MTEVDHKYTIHVELDGGGEQVYTTYDKNDLVTVPIYDSHENRFTNDESKSDSDPVTREMTIEELLRHQPHGYFDCGWETVIEGVDSEDSEEEQEIYHTSIFEVVGYKRNLGYLQYTQVHAPAFQFRIRLT